MAIREAPPVSDRRSPRWIVAPAEVNSVPIPRALLLTTIEALEQLLASEQPADRALRAFFRARARLGSRDRAFTAECIYAIFRHRRFLEEAAQADSARALVLAGLTRFRAVDLQELEPWISENEAAWLAHVNAIREQSLDASIRMELPDWMLERLGRAYDEDELMAIGRALQSAAPLDLRVNTLRIDRAAVLATLENSGLDARPCGLSPDGIRLEGKPSIHGHALLQGGLVELQDEGSQLLSHLVAPRVGERVADFCAGAGGKSLHLGTLMRGQGRLFAFDVSRRRLAGLQPRLRRSGLSNVQTRLLRHERDRFLDRHRSRFDRVLVDAPCTGSGTLRRHPDLRFRVSPQSLGEHQEKQRSILRAAAKLVREGGRLVYATCSLFVEENDHVVERFLHERSDFALLNASQILREQNIEVDSAPYLRLRPDLHETDGFFGAVLERRTSGADPARGG
jgi:16S rRNA (cytosine967-C5)-methyltransferase